MIYLNLFAAFFKVGLFGFGGGYAMIPLMSEAVRDHHWLTDQQFTDIIVITSSAPGPIAANSALFIGYQAAGVPGAMISALSNLLPSFIVVLFLIKLFVKHKQTHALNHSLYGIRPVITALITFAGIQLAMRDGLFSTAADLPQIGILFLAVWMLYKKISPIWVLGISAGLGITIYSM